MCYTREWGWGSAMRMTRDLIGLMQASGKTYKERSVYLEHCLLKRKQTLYWVKAAHYFSLQYEK